MKKYFIILLAALLFVACAEQRTTADKIAIMSVEVTECIDNNNAICVTNDRFHRTVKLESPNNKLYEGANIRGSFVFIGTYSYFDANYNRPRIIPVYMLSSEYKRFE